MSAADGNNASTNPGNFANRPTEEVKAIAAKGGKASHGGQDSKLTDDGEKKASPGRNPDGTFKPGSEAAKEAGHKGGMHSHDNDGKDKSADAASNDDTDNGRNPDGTFKKGSEAAKEAGHKGGVAAAEAA